MFFKIGQTEKAQLSVLLIFFCFFLTNCASRQTVKSSPLSKGGTPPEWLYNPSSKCEAYEICASGEGMGQSESELNAMKSLAAMFETKIKSTLKYSQAESSNPSSQFRESVEEKIELEVNQEVNTILQGVKVKEHFFEGERVFTLSSLNKMTAERLMRLQIKNIDEEMNQLFGLDSRLYFKRLMVLHGKRDLLGQKLTVLGSHAPMAAVSHAQILSLKEKDAKKIALNFSEDLPLIISKTIQQNLNDVGYTIVSNDIAKDYIIDLKWEKQAEYLNVKGFRRFKFLLHVDALDNEGKTVGGFSIQEVMSGREDQDALSKSIEKILSGLDANYIKLNMK